MELVSLFKDTNNELLISAAWDQFLGNVEITSAQREWIESRLEKSEEDLKQGRVHCSDEVDLFIANLGK